MHIKQTFPELYKMDARGLLRVWFMLIGEYPVGTFWHRSEYGRVGGKHHVTQWTLAEPKNIGKSNETTSKTQAEEEVESFDKKKKEQEGYDENPCAVFTPQKRISPMLAKDYEDHKHKIWVAGQIVSVQPKLDGIRCIATKDGLYTRKGKQIVSCPHINREVKELFKLYPAAKFFDGELYNHDLKDDFQKITSIVRKTKPTQHDLDESEKLMQYHIYDVGRDDSFYIRFSNFVMNTLSHKFNHIRVGRTENPQDQNALDKLYSKYTTDGYEGMMVRWGNDPYEHKRSDKLLKMKTFDTEEFEVFGMEEGSGDWSNAIKRLLIKNPNGKAFAAGVRGSYDQLQDLWRSDRCPDWATVRFFGRSNEGIPRFPVVVDYGYEERED